MQLKTNLIILLLSIVTCVIAQTIRTSSKITLKTGTVYVGEIILNNNEIVMLKDSAGARFQFQNNEVAKIEDITEIKKASTTVPDTTKSPTPITHDNFCGRFEISRGYALVSNSPKNPLTAFTLSFGNKKALGKDIFVGLGSGFLMVSNAEVKLVPVYLKVHATTNKNRTSAFWGMESGYSFSINNKYKGGAFTNLSAGMSYKVNYKSSLYLGLIGGVYSVSGNLTESTANGIYAYFGNTTIKMYGLKLGIQF